MGFCPSNLQLLEFKTKNSINKKMIIMKTKSCLKILNISLLSIVMITAVHAQTASPDNKQATEVTQKKEEIKYKVTFVELGSVRCIPCQKMQPVMKAIEEKYAGQVKVVFHDVWTPEGQPFGKKYGIESIPTQVFLDENGKEFSRHVGYFPEEELVKVLKQKGVK
jgi:thioredoxin 1